MNKESVYESKDNCTGCGACSVACPTGCIKMCEDENGYLYPIYDKANCINCGKCHSVCHMMHNLKYDSQPSFYAGYLQEMSMLKDVSSGGASWALMRTILEQNGVIYGAVQKRVGEIVHERSCTIEGIQLFRRSKYLQSRTDDVFESVKKDIADERLVLFTGTACQSAALRAYLGREHDNLITCDVICHGVPSIKAFRKYKHEIEKERGAELIELNCRNKDKGWSNNQYEMVFSDGEKIVESSEKNLFHAGYLAGLFYRESCYSCRYACLPRSSDITLADYWDYRGIIKEKNKDQGISLIVVNTEKGKKLFFDAKKYMFVDETTKDMALSSCRHLSHHPIGNPKRSLFLGLINEMTYGNAFYKCTRVSLIKRVYGKICREIGISINEE